MSGCAICGEPIEAHRPKATMHLACSRRKKEEARQARYDEMRAARQPNNCKVCGEPLESNHPNLRYHKECLRKDQLARKRAQHKLKPKKKKAPPREEKRWIHTEQDAYFYSLVTPKRKAKKVRCLRCQDIFQSFSAGNRVCGSCNESNSRQAVGAYKIYPHD